jgi:hypothetical protein
MAELDPERRESTRTADSDPGLRQMLKWVFVTLVLVVLLAVLVVEVMLRWAGLR